MSIYIDLAQKALAVLNENDLSLDSYTMDEDLTKVVIKNKQDYYTGLTVTPKAEGTLSKPSFTSIKDILTRSLDYSITKRAYGLAAINAIGQFLNSRKFIKTTNDLRKSVYETIVSNADKKSSIVFIGHLSPVVKRLKQEGFNVSVFCRQKSDEAQRIYNDIFEYEAIKKAEVVIMTGASLQGSTCDAVLKFTQNAKAVILAGFSAGGYVNWYKDMGLTHVASLKLCHDLKHEDFEDIFCSESYVVKL